MSSVRLFPLSLPTALADGHGFTPLENARPRERDQGELRLRPRWRRVPERCTARWRFTQAQFDVFEAWFEDVLQAGALDFDVQVQRRGEISGTSAGTTWCTALFESKEGYSAEVDKTQRYLVSAPLLLLEELGPDRVAPSIQATIRTGFGLSARTVPPPIAAQIVLAYGFSAAPRALWTEATMGYSYQLAWTTAQAPNAARATDAAEDRETDDGAARHID